VTDIAHEDATAQDDMASGTDDVNTDSVNTDGVDTEGVDEHEAEERVVAGDAAEATGAAGATETVAHRGYVEGAPQTGNARVDAATALLSGLADRPIPEHPPVFEEVHQRLHGALADLDDE
jgi:hypothetical protein